MLSAEFLLTSLVVVLIPGTGVIYTVSTGIFRGAKASIAAACGCTAGIVPHLLASILGLSTILHVSAVAFQIVKFMGAAYLLYLAWSMWRETGGLTFKAPEQQKNYRQIAVNGILINILNPKLSLFFLAFLPLFVVPGSGSPLLQMFQLSAVFMAMTLAIFIVYGLCANSVRSHVVNSPKVTLWVQRSFAFVFAMFGLKLALTDQ